MNKKLKRICENLDWNIREYETDIELAKYSPAGEDFFFTVNKTNFVDEVIIYAEEFDADEHAEMWVNNMHEVKGVPQSIRTLIEDADAPDAPVASDNEEPTQKESSDEVVLDLEDTIEIEE